MGAPALPDGSESPADPGYAVRAAFDGLAGRLRGEILRLRRVGMPAGYSWAAVLWPLFGARPQSCASWL